MSDYGATNFINNLNSRTSRGTPLTMAPEVLNGKELSNKAIKEIEEFNASASLMKYALSLLKKNHYSEWKMREKLYNKEGKKKDVDRVIKSLKENDLINDKMLVLDTIEYGNERNIGKNKIIQELANKGVFMESINQNLFSHSLEKKKAMNNLSKLEKKYDRYNYESKKQHIYHALLSLGFDNDIALVSKLQMIKVKKRSYLKTLIRLISNIKDNTMDMI